MTSWGFKNEEDWCRNERMMIKNAIYCFGGTVVIWNLIAQPRGIHEMMRSDWSGCFRAAGIKPYLNLMCSAEVFMPFSAGMPCVRYRAGVLTATARSADDMVCLRTSFMHISGRAPCLIDLI